MISVCELSDTGGAEWLASLLWLFRVLVCGWEGVGECEENGGTGV